MTKPKDCQRTELIKDEKGRLFLVPPTCKAILKYLQKHSNVDYEQLSAGLGVSKDVLYVYVKRLVDAKLMDKSSGGRSVSMNVFKALKLDTKVHRI